MKAFLIDISKCNGCYTCQIACKDEHCGNDWTPYAKPQPDTGQFWLKLHEYIRGTVPKVKMHYVPRLCMHCDDAPCMPSCQVGAIYKREDGLVVIDPTKCSGCRSCVDACPYGAIFFNEDLLLAQKCTGCAHLLDQDWKAPRCADVCPTEAIRFMDESELKAYTEKTVLLPERKTRPRVYYMNIPGKFVAGTVYDPVKKEVIIDAACTLKGSGDKRVTGKTDDFGDFWFKDLEVGKYSLTIEAKGFPGKTIDNISTENDVNLGDIALS